MISLGSIGIRNINALAYELRVLKLLDNEISDFPVANNPLVVRKYKGVTGNLILPGESSFLNIGRAQNC
jgi:hypothetical protein